MTVEATLYVIRKGGKFYSGGQSGSFLGPEFKPQLYRHPSQILGMFTNTRGKTWKDMLASVLKGSEVVPVKLSQDGEPVPIEEVIDALR